MPDWLKFLLADTSALQLVFWIIAICALIGAIVKLWPTLNTFIKIVNATAGLPAFIERTDGSIENLRHQVENDHTSNLRDDVTAALEGVDRVERGVKGLYEKVGELTEADAAIRQDLEDTRPGRPPRN